MRETHPVAVRLDNTELICPCRGERHKPKVAPRVRRLVLLFRVIEVWPDFSPHALPNSLEYRGDLVLVRLAPSFGCVVLIASALPDQVIVPDLERVLEEPNARQRRNDVDAVLAIFRWKRNFRAQVTIGESCPPRIKQAPSQRRTVDLPGVERLAVFVPGQMLQQSLSVQLAGNLQVQWRIGHACRLNNPVQTARVLDPAISLDIVESRFL